MNDKKWLKYWRKSLIDSLKADIDIKNQEHFEIENFEMNTPTVLDLGRLSELIDSEEGAFNKKKYGQFSPLHLDIRPFYRCF